MKHVFNAGRSVFDRFLQWSGQEAEYVNKESRTAMRFVFKCPPSADSSPFIHFTFKSQTLSCGWTDLQKAKPFKFPLSFQIPDRPTTQSFSFCFPVVLNARYTSNAALSLCLPACPSSYKSAAKAHMATEAGGGGEGRASDI